MKYIKILTLAICLFTIASCAANQRIIVDENYRKVKRPYAVNAKHHFMLGGVGQSRTINAKEYCSEMDLELGAVDFRSNYWVQGLTFGIYSPRTMKIYCFKNRKKK